MLDYFALYMNKPAVAAFLLFHLAVILVAQWFKTVRTLRQHDQKSKEYNCLPPKTLHRKPYYFGLDVVQNMFQSYYSGTRNRQLQKRFDEVGDTYRLQPWGTARIYTRDPANVKAAFTGNASEWGVESMRLEAFKPFIGAGVLVTDGPHWTKARSICQPILDKIHRARQADLRKLDWVIELLMDQIPKDGSTIDLKPLFNRYMIDSATTYIFGQSIGALLPGEAGKEGKAFMEAFLYALVAVGKRNELPQWTQISLDNKFHESCRFVHKIAGRFVNQALTQLKENPDIEPPSPNLAREWAKVTKDPVEIRNQILNVLVAAFDTTSITLAHAMFHLARSPERYEKLRQEALDSDMPKQGENLKSLPYLQAVIKETMRISTAATFNSRIALKDNILPRGGGPNGDSPVLVPKGEIVICSVYALQRRNQVFGEDENAFVPERWETVKPGHWDFIPFSAGTRVCPGMRLANVQTAYTLFCIARRFHTVENRDPVMEFVEEYQVSTSSRNGAKVAMFDD